MKLAKYHPKFLGAIKEAQPLAYLASFMLLISIFSTEWLIGAETYALSCSFIFLLAFLFSLAYKISNYTVMAILSYIMAGIGFLLTFVLIYKFTILVPTIGWAVLGGYVILVFILILIPTDYAILKSLIHDLKDGTKKNAISIFGNIFLFIGFLSATMVVTISGIGIWTEILPDGYISTAYLWFLGAFLIIGIITKVLQKMMTKTKRGK